MIKKILTSLTALTLTASPVLANDYTLRQDKKESISTLETGLAVTTFIAQLGYVFSSSDVQPDKKLHYLASFVWTEFFGAIIKPETWYGHLAVASLGFSVGLGKEAYDEYTYGGWDNKDLLWDGLGVLHGVGLNLQIYRNFDVRLAE